MNHFNSQDVTFLDLRHLGIEKIKDGKSDVVINWIVT